LGRPWTFCANLVATRNYSSLRAPSRRSAISRHCSARQRQFSARASSLAASIRSIRLMSLRRYTACNGFPDRQKPDSPTLSSYPPVRMDEEGTFRVAARTTKRDGPHSHAPFPGGNQQGQRDCGADPALIQGATAHSIVTPFAQGCPYLRPQRVTRAFRIVEARYIRRLNRPRSKN